MDEVVQYCLSEIAFEGDLGCNFEQLKQIIESFYESHSSVQQSLDDHYCSFILSLIQHQPSIKIGILPSEPQAHVFVPPLPRAGNKDKDGEGAGPGRPSTVAKLNEVPEAKTFTMNELLAKYGRSLRIAVEPEAIFVALTGSHIKPTKLTPPLYAALQIIGRAREVGVSAVELGKATGYDQKTISYMLKQLVALNFVVKLRRGGNSQNFAVHKYFYDRSPAWKEVRGEESRGQVDNGQDEGRAEDTWDLHFEPINIRHLTNLSIVRQRIVRLLKHTPDGIVPYTNIAIRIGFHPSDRTDRRFFLTRLNELIKDGVIEKVSMSGNTVGASRTIFIRLVRQRSEADGQKYSIVQEQSDDDEELVAIEADDTEGLKANVTLHRQAVDLIEQSGMKGITLNELLENLQQFDRRTVELFLSRMLDQPPPPHLADLSIIQVQELCGKEKRYRYFTLPGYTELMSRENFQVSTGKYTAKDLDNAGTYSIHVGGEFYVNNHELMMDLKKYKSEGGPRRKQGRPRKDAQLKKPEITVPENNIALEGRSDGVIQLEDRREESSGQKKRKQKKEKVFKNPLLPDGTRKRGRPVKDPEIAEQRRLKKLKKDEEKNVAAEDAAQAQENARPTRKRKRSDGEDRGKKLDSAGEVSPSVPENMYPSPNEESSRSPTTIITSPLTVAEPSVKRKQGTHIGKLKFTENVEVPANASELEHLSLPYAIEDNVIDRDSSDIATTKLQDAISEVPAVSDGKVRSPAPRSEIEDLIASTIGSAQIDRSAAFEVDWGASTNEPSLVDEDVADYATPQLGPVGKLVPASFTQDTEQTPASPSTDVQKNVLDILNDPMSPLTELSEDDPVSPSMENPSIPAASLIDESQDASLTEISGDPITAPTENCTDTQLGSTKDDNTYLTQKDVVLPSDPTKTPIFKKKKRSENREAKSSISRIRRENELVRLIEESGGILNTTPSTFTNAYKQLLDTLAKAGEATSVPIGNQMDRKTLKIALDNLESAGRIKMLITNVWTAVNGSRRVKIAYLPHISEEDVRKFQSSLGSLLSAQPGTEDRPVNKKTEIDPTGPRAIAEKWMRDNSRVMSQERWGKDRERAESLLKLGDEAMREAFRMEKQTLSQAYGFLVGKLMRARALHVHIIQQFECAVTSQYIISPEDRVVDWAYFDCDVPLSVYCTCVSSIAFMREIKNALETDDGRRMPVKEVPGEWRAALRAGRMISRDRIIELLEVLRALKVVTPLRSYAATDTDGINHTMRFQPMPPGWDSNVPIVYPQYWQFNTTAPIFLTAPRKSPPPLYRDMPITTSDEVHKFWDMLRSASLDVAYCESLLLASQFSYPDFKAYNKRIIAALGRTNSWQSEYAFTWHQRYFLEEHVVALGDSENDPDQIAKLAYILSAPTKDVQKYLGEARELRNKELLRIRLKEEQRELKKQKALSLKSLLAEKGAEIVKQREKAWNTLLEKVSDFTGQVADTPRLKRLRRLFIQGNVVQDTGAWEKQISEALRAAEKAKGVRKILHADALATSVLPVTVQPANVGHADQSVQMVIDFETNCYVPVEEQKSAGTSKRSLKKRPKPSEVSEEKSKSRRKRYPWHEEDDELVRDAYAVIKARCGSRRLDYSALDQLFPVGRRDRVRLRIKRLKEKPGAEGYLQRLGAAWTDVWEKHRGTPALPDENPDSLTEFDLKAHVDFLRKHVDKNALRVGILPVMEEISYVLPLDVPELLSNYDLSERNPQYGFDFLSNAATGEEAREKLFLHDMLVLENDFPPEEPIDDQIAHAESALKVVIGTPNEDYDPHCAAALLNVIGDICIQQATSNLLSQNVCAKLVRDPTRLAPGRTLKISEANQNALTGPVSRDLFIDAVQSERTLAAEQDEWREWPLTSTDGDTAALLQLLSDHRSLIKFDISHAMKRMASLDGNSKKAYDDDFEIQLEFRVQDSSTMDDYRSPQVLADSYSSERVSSDNVRHGTTVSGDVACCSLSSEGVTDCTGCIENSLTQIDDWLEGDQLIARQVLEVVEGYGSRGIQTNELRTMIKGECTEIVEQLLSLSVPALYPVGYRTPLLVSAKYVSPWTIILPHTRGSESPSVSKIFPRRWLDIKGNRIAEVWEAALRAVVGYVHLRPGISHADLRQRLKSVYDRQEVMDLTMHLTSEGYLICRTSKGLPVPMPKTAIALEERSMHWFINDQKHWYMIR